jgi:hypothetical protein
MTEDEQQHDLAFIGEGKQLETSDSEKREIKLCKGCSPDSGEHPLG